MNRDSKYEAIVIGISSGGLNFLKEMLPQLTSEFSIPIIVVQHMGDTTDDSWIRILNNYCKLPVKEAEEKEQINTGQIYSAPANYHLLIEPDHSFTFTVDDKVNYARPSIDVLFETAAWTYKNKLIGIIGTGANFDGARGLLEVKKNGGLTIVQEPKTAETTSMPEAAVKLVAPHYILPINDIVKLIMNIHNKQTAINEYKN